MEEYFVDSPINIKITSELENLWDSLGTDSSDRNSHVQEMLIEMRHVYKSHIDKLRKQLYESREEIERIQQKYRQAMIAFGVSENEISQSIVPIQNKNIIQQLNDVTKLYESFKVVIADRVQKIENMVHIAKALFDNLEIPNSERGEFSEIGETDFTRERVDKFRQKIDDLKRIEEQRKVEISKIKDNIRELLSQTGESNNQKYLLTLSNQSIGISFVEELTQIEINLKKEKEFRINELSQMAIAITHLWDHLGVPENERIVFLSKYSTVSPEVMQSCKTEIARLSKLRDEKLPQLIASQRQEIEALWEKLHVAVESRPIFENQGLGNHESQIKEYEFLEKETLRLKSIEVEYHTILETINQRESIINEYNETVSVSNDPVRLTSRERGKAQQLIKEEKARRRYKTMLPKIEKKLLQLLTDYRIKNGTDFEWDGRPYLDQLPQARSLMPAKDDIDQRGNTLPKMKKVLFVNNENEQKNPMSFKIKLHK